MIELVLGGENETFFVGPARRLIGSDDVPDRIIFDASLIF